MNFNQELKTRVSLFDLANVVKVRLLGINDAIRGLRKKKPHNKDEANFIKLSIEQLTVARKKTNVILNKLVLLKDKELDTVDEITQLKNEFMKMSFKGEIDE